VGTAMVDHPAEFFAYLGSDHVFCQKLLIAFSESGAHCILDFQKNADRSKSFTAEVNRSGRCCYDLGQFSTPTNNAHIAIVVDCSSIDDTLESAYKRIAELESMFKSATISLIGADEHEYHPISRTTSVSVITFDSANEKHRHTEKIVSLTLSASSCRSSEPAYIKIHLRSND
jgi:hypothetical protein